MAQYDLYHDPKGYEGDIADSNIKKYVRSYSSGSAAKKKVSITVTAVNDATYMVTIEGTSVSYLADGSATTGEIVAGLISAINSNPVIYGKVVASTKDADELYVESRTSLSDFAISVGANLSVATVTAYSAGAVVPFGIAVALGSSDETLKILTATTDKVLGVAVRTHGGLVNDGVNGYPANSDVSVLCEGTIWVKVEEAVVAEDPVYVRAVATGNEVAGAFRKSVDSTDCIQLTKSKYLTSASAGERAVVHIGM